MALITSRESSSRVRPRGVAGRRSAGAPGAALAGAFFSKVRVGGGSLALTGRSRGFSACKNLDMLQHRWCGMSPAACKCGTVRIMT